MAEFVDDMSVDGFDHVADSAGRIWTMFKITSQPAYVFINDTGEMDRSFGALDADALAERVQALVDS